VLSNISFRQRDGWAGVDKQVNIGALLLDANNLSFTKKIIDINSLELERPVFLQASYPGNRPPSTIKITSANGRTITTTRLYNGTRKTGQFLLTT
jgi:hypothetical protein